MAHSQIDWLLNNDMLVKVSAVQTSTMSTTEYLNSSTGFTADIYDAQTTASTSVAQSNVAYSTLVNSGDGGYQVVIASTDHSLVQGNVGMAVITLAHSGSDAEWRIRFVVHERGTT